MTLHATATAENAEPSQSAMGLIASEMASLEERILELSTSSQATLTTIGRELIGSGGKRVRPALALLVFRAAGGADPTDVIDIGAAIELIHSATLLHDDILDRGLVRRGKPSPLARHGTERTLVTGDFLFSRAFGVAGRFDSLVVGWATDACTQLCEGEILQQKFRHNSEVKLEDYLSIVECKTASLFRQAARIGAHLAGAPGELVDAMYRFGQEIGVAFQMMDDLLDVEGPEELIGKSVGSDLREGSPALTTILALPSAPKVREAFLDPNPTKETVDAALVELRASGVLDQVRSMVASRLLCAQEQLEQLGPSPYRDALNQLTKSMLERTA